MEPRAIDPRAVRLDVGSDDGSDDANPYRGGTPWKWAKSEGAVGDNGDNGDNGGNVGVGSGDVDCSVTCWFASPCEGDCWYATREQQCSVVQTNTGAGAPCPALASQVSCNDSMPCVCRGSDLTPMLEGRALVPCTDCTLVAPGSACFLKCDGDGMQLQGVPEATCVNGTWAWAGLPATCVPALATCPTIVLGDASAGCANTGVVAGPLGICAGAVHGDFCNISCMSGYAIGGAPGATSAAYCVNGSWSLDRDGTTPATLACTPQAGCVEGVGPSDGSNGDTCAPGGSCPTPNTGAWGRGWAPGIAALARR